MVFLGVGEKVTLFAVGAYLLNKFLPASITSSILIAILVIQIYFWYRAVTLWQRLGVPCAPAWPLLGHIIEFTSRGVQTCDMEWTKKFGKVYGSYFFTQPEIVIADQELLKKILVKDFHHFSNRRNFFNLSKKSLFMRVVSALKDEDWKNTRNKITPAFTSGKLKGTIHLMENCVNTMCTILDEQNDFENGVDVKMVMGNMTMDVIASAAFAMNVDAQHNPNDEFTKYAQELGNLSFRNWSVLVSSFFPFVVLMLDEVFGIRIFMKKMEEFYINSLSKVIKERRETPLIDKLDFLQLLINAADQEKQENGDIDTTIDNGLSPSKAWSMTDRDIIAQSFLFLFAGHETTATTLSFSCYLLAWHPEEQEKCYQEIRGLVEQDEDENLSGSRGPCLTNLHVRIYRAITYTHIQRGMPYLEAVMNETLRIFPPVIRFDRTCQSDYQLTDKIRIPAGSIVCVPAYAIHHDAEIYEDPEKFDPERFLLKERRSKNPFAFLPFGYGPRNCIGMRFAQLEYKLALSNLLRKFRIEPCSKTEPMPLQLATTGLLKPKYPVCLNFKRRDE